LKNNIVVIGNGSSVLNDEFGHLIDEFDEVVRFNLFETYGYERYVGSKTTIWFRNSGPMKERDESQFKQVIVQSVDHPNEWTDHSVYERYSRVDDETIADIRKIVKTPFNLSTGIQALGYLTRKYGKITIYGFDVFDPPRLYFQSEIIDIRHSTDEKKYIDYLKEKKLVEELKEKEVKWL